MVATKPVDFRMGAEGLAALVRETMGADPFNGAVYVFRAKRTDRNQADLLGWHRGFASMPTNWLHTTTLSLKSEHFEELSRRMASARWASWFHRLHCLAGTCGPGSS
ncbi:IS66 family insertion sequence element accessory protein TnpB [Mesorhizobium sp.]|uniref:IS66 family insertion sequence element accessory protein TnpB n=1 Tax=Mesorhizobium sp. TaxID=1871066 RepID=UPI0033905C5A